MAIAARSLRSPDFFSHSQKRQAEVKHAEPVEKKYGDFITTAQPLVAALERWRQRGARPVDAAGLWRAAPDGAALHGSAACGPHAADDGVDPRSLFAAGRTGGETMGEPRPFLRRRGEGDAPHPDGLRPHSEQGQTRRRRAAGFAG